jgi:hypothetical protein
MIVARENNRRQKQLYLLGPCINETFVALTRVSQRIQIRVLRLPP